MARLSRRLWGATSLKTAAKEATSMHAFEVFRAKPESGLNDEILH